MTTQTYRGRRRAAGPASQPAVAEVSLAERPRDPQREARRHRSPFRQLTDFAAASGLGQKAGVALAASGLLLTVTMPATSPVLASSSSPVAASSASAAEASSQPAVIAEAAARIDFSRTAVTTQNDPDGKLKQLLSAHAAATVTPAASAGSLAGPLAVLTTVSPYGYRVSPITGGTGDFHRGTDFAAQCGTPVLASATGTVTFAGWHPYGGGNRVVVDHGNGLETTYNHLSSFTAAVGQKVNRGDAVALSGTTGASTGCHLHFEVQVNGEVVDPAGWL